MISSRSGFGADRARSLGLGSDIGGLEGIVVSRGSRATDNYAPQRPVGEAPRGFIGGGRSVYDFSTWDESGRRGSGGMGEGEGASSNDARPNLQTVKELKAHKKSITKAYKDEKWGEALRLIGQLIEAGHATYNKYYFPGLIFLATRHGHLEAMERLIEEDESNLELINARDKATPLTTAIKRGLRQPDYVGVINFLVSRGADVNSESAELPMKLLLGRCISTSAKKGVVRRAIQILHKAGAKKLDANEIIKSARGRAKQTVLESARDCNVVNLVVIGGRDASPGAYEAGDTDSNKENITRKRINPTTTKTQEKFKKLTNAIKRAYKQKDLPKVLRLIDGVIEAGNANLNEHYFQSPVYKATRNGHPEAIRRLVEKGKVDINLKRYFSDKTPLTTAINRSFKKEKDYCEIIELLISLGADANIPGPKLPMKLLLGKCPRTNKERKTLRRAIEILHNGGAKKLDGSDTIDKGKIRGKITVLERAKTHDVVDLVVIGGDTSRPRALEANRVAVRQKVDLNDFKGDLIEKFRQIKTEIINAYGKQDLGRALALIELVIEQKQANLNDYYFLPPIFIATRYGHLEAMKMLCEGGAANLNLNCYQGNATPLTSAINRKLSEENYIEIIEFLIARGVDVNKAEPTLPMGLLLGKTPKDAEHKRKVRRAIEILHNNGAKKLHPNRTIPSKNRTRPKTVIEGAQFYDVVEMVVEGREVCDPNSVTSSGSSKKRAADDDDGRGSVKRQKTGEHTYV